MGYCVVDLKIRFNLKMCGWELKRNEIVIKSKYINKKIKLTRQDGGGKKK